MALIWIWAFRLNDNYFRREKWRLGWREDWRLGQYRAQFGVWWYPASFFMAYLSQHVMLFGLSLPLYAVFNSKAAFGIYDIIGIILSLFGIVFAYISDN